MAWFSHCFQNLDIPRLAPLQQKGRLIILTGKSKHYKLENDHKPDKYKGNVLVPSGGGGGTNNHKKVKNHSIDSSFIVRNNCRFIAGVDELHQSPFARVTFLESIC